MAVNGYARGLDGSGPSQDQEVLRVVISGIDVLRALRASHRLPVLLLTARSASCPWCRSRH